MESLPREVGRGAGTITSKGYGMMEAFQIVRSIIDSLQQDQDMGEVSDGHHTFNELYYYRMLYNAAFFNLLPKGWVHKSKRHHTGEECFGGGWFIVMANLPTGQVSNHYELKDWDLFQVPEKEFADEWDGHTPQEAAKRLYEYLQQEQPKMNIPSAGSGAMGTTPPKFKLDVKPDLPVGLEKEIQEYLEKLGGGHGGFVDDLTDDDLTGFAHHFYELGLNAKKEGAK